VLGFLLHRVVLPFGLLGFACKGVWFNPFWFKKPFSSPIKPGRLGFSQRGRFPFAGAERYRLPGAAMSITLERT
ncbi:hypothetical protein, partial [Nocardia cyriacigeorgica]|uniref:hypothetical protein n=1 Tax=Nocardia cyriacigeorgica TaxID=135487 RepID=UPI002454E633